MSLELAGPGPGCQGQGSRAGMRRKPGRTVPGSGPAPPDPKGSTSQLVQPQVGLLLSPGFWLFCGAEGGVWQSESVNYIQHRRSVWA